MIRRLIILGLLIGLPIAMIKWESVAFICGGLVAIGIPFLAFEAWWHARHSQDPAPADEDEQTDIEPESVENPQQENGAEQAPDASERADLEQDSEVTRDKDPDLRLEQPLPTAGSRRRSVRYRASGETRQAPINPDIHEAIEP